MIHVDITGQPLGPSFPTFPARRVVPATAVQGLGVGKSSSAPDAAVTFLLWLLAEPQQRLLASVGVPPVLQTRALADAWQSFAASGQWPQFDQPAYFDVDKQLDQAAPKAGAPPTLAYYVQQALVQMYTTGDVASGIDTLQQLLR